MRVENPCVAAAALTPAAAQRGSRVYCCMVTVLARQVHGAARARFFRRNEAMATGAARQHSPHIAGGRYAAKAGGGCGLGRMTRVASENSSRQARLG